jgi:hypothetical protein
MGRVILASHFITFLGGRATPVKECLRTRRITICPHSAGFFEPQKEGLPSLRPRSHSSPTVRTVWSVTTLVFTTPQAARLLGIPLAVLDEVLSRGRRTTL